MATDRRSGRKATERALRLVSKFLSTITDQEFDDFIRGTAFLQLRRIEEKEAGSSLKTMRRNEPNHHSDFVNQTLSELEAATSTDEGFEILGEALLTRAELETIANKYSIPVAKQDDSLRLSEKIIQNVIGSLLNSRAIRGK